MWQATVGQVSLLNQRQPIEKLLKDETISEEKKKKFQLINEVRQFAETELHLAKSDNYTSFVELKQPYVSYALSAAPKWELKNKTWWFPITGHVPYLGYFKEADAKEREQDLIKEGLDTYVRGISAYSTLGWFSDPVLSSMLNYREHWLVETIIHETVHATLFIKNSADFNERLATFVAQIGTEQFYKRREGEKSPTVARIRDENFDQNLFSEFISGEIKALREWYPQQKTRDEMTRKNRLAEIQQQFQKTVAPRLRTKDHSHFVKTQLNNASLLVYATYLQDLSDFQKLFDQLGRDMKAFLDACKKLESHTNPELSLKELVKRH